MAGGDGELVGHGAMIRQTRDRCERLGPRDLIHVSAGARQRELVMEALRRTGYVQKRAADLLGISRRKLNYMIQRMGITHSAWRRNRGSGGDPDSSQEPCVARSSENP